MLSESLSRPLKPHAVCCPAQGRVASALQGAGYAPSEWVATMEDLDAETLSELCESFAREEAGGVG